MDRPHLSFSSLTYLWRPDLAHAVVGYLEGRGVECKPRNFALGKLANSNNTEAEQFTCRLLYLFCACGWGQSNLSGIPNRKRIDSACAAWTLFHTPSKRGITYDDLRRLIDLFQLHVLEDNNPDL